MPTIINFEGDFYVYAAGQIHMLAAKLKVGGLVHLEGSEGITLGAAEVGALSYISITKKGMGIAFKASGDEVSIRSGYAYKTTTSEIIDIEQIGMMINAGRLEIETGGTYSRIGGVHHVGSVSIKAGNMVEEACQTTHSEKLTSTHWEVGSGIGLQSSVGQLARAVDTMTESDLETKSGAINAALAAMSAGSALASIATGGLVTYGIFIYAGFAKAVNKMSSTTPVPAVTIAGSVEIEIADNLSIEGSQWLVAGDASISAGSMNVTAASGDLSYKTRSTSSGATIAVAGTMGSSAQLGYGNSEGTATSYQNAHLSFGGKLNLKVKEQAEFKGAVIDAHEVYAAFGALLLESLQDQARHQGYGFNLSLDPKNYDSLKMLAGMFGSRDRASKSWASEMSSIIGHESAQIVIEGTLELVGAMIATLEKNPDGTLTDQGKLKLKAAKLITRDLNDHDKGLTTGLGVTRGGVNDKDNTGNGVGPGAQVEYAHHHSTQLDRATLGQGELEISGYDGNINRNINKAQILTRDDRTEKISGTIYNPVAIFKAMKNLPENMQTTWDKAKGDFAVLGGWVMDGIGIKPNINPEITSARITDDIASALKKENIDSETAETIADNLTAELEFYIDAQRAKDPNHQPTEAEIKEFILDQMQNQNLCLGQGSTSEDTAELLLSSQAVRACASSLVCVATLAAASLAYAGYVLYKNADSDDNTDISYKKQHGTDNKQKVTGQPDTYGTPPEGDDNNDSDDWEKNPTKAESSVWKELKPYKGI